MSHPCRRPLRPACLPFLLLAPAPLAAMITLEGVPPICREEAPQPFRVRVQGAGEGRVVKLAIWREGALAREQFLLTGPNGEAEGVLQWMRTASAGWVTLAASLPEGPSVSRTVRLLPAQPPPSGHAPAAPPPARPLPALSAELWTHIAGFADHPAQLPAVSRPLRGPAHRGTLQVRIQQPIDDEELARRLAPLARLEALELHTAGPGLTSQGIRRALEHLHSLKRLVLEGPVLAREDARAILSGQPHLTCLRIPGTPLLPEDLAALPAGLVELQLQGCPVPDGALSGLPALDVLELARCPSFQGLGLPASLRRLRVASCPGFSPGSLPAGLEELSVEASPRFAGAFELPRLLRLELIQCPGFQGEDLELLLARAQGLLYLSVDRELPRRVLARASGTLTVLRIRSAHASDRDLERFSNLVELTLHRNHQVTGAGLPARLRSLCLVNCREVRTWNLADLPLAYLRLHGCPRVDGRRLPATLRALSVADCPFFSASALPPELEDLSLDRVPLVPGERGRWLATLRKLTYLSCEPEHLGSDPASLFWRCPTLARMDLRLPDGQFDIFERPAATDRKASRSCAIL